MTLWGVVRVTVHETVGFGITLNTCGFRSFSHLARLRRTRIVTKMNCTLDSLSLSTPVMCSLEPIYYSLREVDDRRGWYPDTSDVQLQVLGMGSIA
jgi:hypothetical protein